MKQHKGRRYPKAASLLENLCGTHNTIALDPATSLSTATYTFSRPPLLLPEEEEEEEEEGSGESPACDTGERPAPSFLSCCPGAQQLRSGQLWSRPLLLAALHFIPFSLLHPLFFPDLSPTLYMFICAYIDSLYVLCSRLVAVHTHTHLILA
jgi:hypothetical protein